VPTRRGATEYLIARDLLMNRARWKLTVTLAGLGLTVSVAASASAQSPTTSADPVTLTVGSEYDLFTSNPLRVCACGNEYEFLGLNYNMLLRFNAMDEVVNPRIRGR